MNVILPPASAPRPSGKRTLNARRMALVTAVAAVGAAVRAGYAARMGMPVPWSAVAGGAVFVLAVAAVGAKGGARAGIYASLAAALTPGFVLSQTLSAGASWAMAAAAAAAFFFEEALARGSAAPAVAGGVAAAAAAALLPTAAVVPGFLVARVLVTAEGRRRAARLLPPFVAAATAAFVTASYAGLTAGEWRTATPFPPFVYQDPLTLGKRLGMDAAGELLWNGRGFGVLTIAAGAAVITAGLKRSRDLAPYAVAFVLSLTLFNFAPTTPRGYYPLAFEPRLWAPAFLPGCVVLGAVLAQLHTAADVRAAGDWTRSWGAVVLLAAVFLKATLPHAVANLCALAVATILILTGHGWLSRRRTPFAAGPAYAFVTVGVFATAIAAALV